MSIHDSMFKNPEHQARFFAVYDATLALWPVPVESITVPTRFGTTHVNVCGPADAPPLVLLTGQGASSMIWYANVATLSQAHRIYAVDIIGDIGKSVLTQPRLTVQEYAPWLNEVFAELGLERPYLAGLSFGGFIALRFALAFPERIRKLVLMAPAGLLSLRPSFFLRMAAMFLPSFLLSLESKQKLVFGSDSPNVMPIIKLITSTKGFRMNMVFPPVFTDEELQQVKAPTLLLMGDQEVVYNYQAVAERVANLIPTIETDIIAGAGHALNLDQPEVVNQRVLAFLKKEALLSEDSYL